MTIDVDSIKSLVRSEYRARIESGGISATFLFIDEMTAEVCARDPDVEQIVRSIIRNTIDAEARQRTRGVRTAEIVTNDEGARVDVGHQQLQIAQLAEVGERKVNHGQASILEGEADIAVAMECERRARTVGLDPLATLVGMVMSRDEEIAFRDEIRKAA